MIGVIGLGLIGGSMAKAINQNTDYTVYGYDIVIPTLHKAAMVGAIEGELTDEILSQCDITIVAMYPEDTVNYIKEKASIFKKGSIVTDCSGVKQFVCDSLRETASESGFVFIGGHPMAGLEHAGFEYAKRSLFDDASMVLTPFKGTTIEDVQKLKTLYAKIGFANIQIATPKEHDRMVAFTSQLAHIVSGAYIKSPTAENHMGFSAGSYRDMTRVAKLNEEMWSELFLENRENLSAEVGNIIDRLTEYKEALDANDRATLRAILKDGRHRKEKIDKEYF